MPEEPKQPAAAVADVNDPNAPEPGAAAVAGAGRVVEQRDRGAWPSVDLAAGDGCLVSVVKMEALGIAPDFMNMSASLDKGRDRIIAKVKALQPNWATTWVSTSVAGDADLYAPAGRAH